MAGQIQSVFKKYGVTPEVVDEIRQDMTITTTKQGEILSAQGELKTEVGKLKTQNQDILKAFDEQKVQFNQLIMKLNQQQ